MTEELSKFFEENKKTLLLFESVNNSQSQSGMMMNSVFNAVISINSILENLKEMNAKGFENLKDFLVNRQTDDTCGQGEICNILDIILQKMAGQDTCQQQDAVDPKALDRIAERQEESNILIKELMNQTSKLDLFEKELQNALKENLELRKKLDKKTSEIR